MGTRKKHMDEFLKEAFTRYISIKDADYKKAQGVFNSVFDQVKLKMCEKDNFFAKYSSQVMNAGSVYDGIKVGKLDEFDMDIVIRLPISYENNELGIIMENHKPGFVKMKIIHAFDNMDKQPDWERTHRVTRDWRDEHKYFLQSRFRHWMQSIVQKAVSDLGNRVIVEGVPYQLSFREAGPAFTLLIRNEGGEPFELDVDLVPVIKFQLPRWPQGYRKVQDTQIKDWLVVPKPLKDAPDETTKGRCWRLAFHEFERDLIKGCELLKLTIRLLTFGVIFILLEWRGGADICHLKQNIFNIANVKKLRDSLEMKAIASYYIKTLFLWEIEEKGKKYWQNKISILFFNMVEKMHKAIEAKKIAYYWHKDLNLIEAVRPALLKVYSDKLELFLARFKANDIDGVIAHLLTPQEMLEFRQTDFYKSHQSTPTVETPIKREVQLQQIPKKREEMRDRSVSSEPLMDSTTNDLLKELLTSNKRLESKLESLVRKIENKVDTLSDRVDQLSDNLLMVKMQVKRTEERVEGFTKGLKDAGQNGVSGEMVLNVLANQSEPLINFLH